MYDQEIGEQVLQDSFANIWRQALDYDAARGSLFGWILKVTSNARMRSLTYQYHISVRLVF